MSKQNKKIKLKNIYLATKNPRIADKIQFDDINNGNFFRENQENNDEKNLRELLNYEGNCDTLLELFKSIKNEYNDMLENPILIHSNNNENEYIVVEGNRRIIVLKCLHSLVRFPKNINEWNFMIEDEITLDNKNEDDKIDKKKIEKNFKQINKIIEEYKFSDSEFELKVNIIEKNKEENQEISIAIFSNHVTGDKRGKRNWNRGKTLDMYMNFWQTIKVKTKDEKIKQISNLLNRSEREVKDNLYSANFIFYLIDKSEKDKNKYYKKNKISSLQLQFIKKFINFNNEKRWDYEIEYKPNLNYKEVIFKSKNNKFEDKELAKFIINSFEKNYFNTRGIVNKKQKEASNKLSLFFQESERFLKENNDFQKSISKIGEKNIIEAINIKNSLENNNTREFIEFIDKNIEIVKNNSFKVIYKNKLANLEPFKNVFDNLFNQYKLLIENKKNVKIKDFPISGIISIFRSLIENLCYFLMYDKNLFKQFKNSDLFKEIKIDGKSIDKKNENFQFIFLNSKAENLHKTYTFLRRKIEKNNEFELQISNSIKFLMNNKSINIENLKNIFYKSIFQKISKIIHSPHLLFLKNNNEQLNILKENTLFLENLINLFKEIKIIE